MLLDPESMDDVLVERPEQACRFTAINLNTPNHSMDNKI